MPSSAAVLKSDISARLPTRTGKIVCFHCGLTVPPRVEWWIDYDGARRPLCCAGCQAVAETILTHGLDAYYRERSAVAARPAAMSPTLDAMLGALDSPALQQQYAASEDQAAGATTALALEGLTCAACAWLLEKRLAQIEGITSARVNYASQQAEIAWDAARVPFSQILRAIRNLGFEAAPLALSERRTALAAHYRRELTRFGISALFAMQVMMIAAAFYFDAPPEREPMTGVLNWLSAALAVPVVTYGAWPFYRGAWRAWRARGVTMDVPISLAIVLGYGGSLVALRDLAGVVYFDSITMFISLLLLSRLLELGALRRSGVYLDSLARVVPSKVQRFGRSGQIDEVFTDTLAIGECIRVRTGEVIPCDGIVRNGYSGVDESVLTGESVAVTKKPGMRVVRGSTNQESSLDIEVTAVGRATALAQIADVAQRALAAKPHTTLEAERVASAFIWIVLALAGITAAFHGLWRGEPWLAPTLAVLVISCPCALALAVPTAINTAMSVLLRHGVLVVRPDALRALARARAIAFDKTGTLTKGRCRLAQLIVHPTPMERDEVLAIAMALEAGTTHPIGTALQAVRCARRYAADEVTNTPGHGVSGVVNGVRYWLGTATFATAAGISVELPNLVGATQVVLAREGELLATLRFIDTVRSEAAEVVRYFKLCDITSAVLSGDRREVAESLATTLEIPQVYAPRAPMEKVATIARMAAAGQTVVAVGDGINDAPMLASAQVGVTLGAATHYAKLNADIVLLKSDLRGLTFAHRVARRMLRISRQNLGWAFAYNGIALACALSGVITPWLAALAMTLSSLVMVGNAARLARVKEWEWK